MSYMRMKWASHVSAEAALREGIADCGRMIRRRLDGEQPDLSILFLSPQYRKDYAEATSLVQEHLPSRVLIGCSAQGVIGGGKEVEDRPAVSLTSAVLPDVDIYPLYADTRALPDEDSPPEAWCSLYGIPGGDDAQFVILADPFTADIETFVGGLDYAFPNGAKVGGMASGGRRAQENVLYLNDQHFTQGLVSVALTGNIALDTIVAQGCRPIGRPLPVTQCQQNLLVEVGGCPPLEYLEELTASLSEADRKLLRTSLFLGVAMDPFKGEPRHGDFLVRNLIGVDYNTGALVVGALLTEGQMVQFHLRDRRTSAEDLTAMLNRYREDHDVAEGRGALLFSCLGRGKYLYGKPDHDTNLFLRDVGPMALGGFFCNGEIGPVGPSTYIHGYTSSFGIFRPAENGLG